MIGITTTQKPLHEIINELPYEVLMNFNDFVKVANNVRNLAKACNPSVVRESTKLEKFKRSVVDSIRRGWLEKKSIREDVARKAIDYVYEIYNNALKEAEFYLDICIKK